MAKIKSLLTSLVNSHFSVFLFPLLFLCIGLFTLYDYGINWDSPIHFARGQAYLRYMLTGKTNYDGLPNFCMNVENLNSRVDVKSGEVCDRHRKVRVSEYESNLLDFSWAVKNVYGHPAFSDIMLAVSNNIFFKTLGWVEDINAYHLYSLFTTFLLALTVSIWTKQTFGTFASIIAVLTIYTLPLLVGEQHFNIKDPPMAAFFTISIYFFWLAFVKDKSSYLILSALAGGASFGTKFNFVFAPFILLPWIIAFATPMLPSLSKKMFIATALYPIIVFLVFFLSWPAMWEDPLRNLPQVFRFYHDIGSSPCGHSYSEGTNFVNFTYSWLTGCTQLTTLKYFIYTVPPFSLFLFTIGLIVSAIWFKKKNYFPLLLISFFAVTILRVTLPIASIYGGLRQIMEFIAPMAMIIGIGAYFLRDLISKILVKFSFIKKLGKETITLGVSLLFILGYIPAATEMIKLHPNQNVYFNFFIGGLKGAAEKNFPGYGNTYGNAYLQGVTWLNQHAEPNSEFGLVSGNMQNIPRGIIREDISFANGYRSGYNQKGEYLMSLIIGQDQFSKTFRYEYLNTYLNPIYNLKIDGVPILKIWKNDKDYVKNGVNLNETREQIETSIDRKEKIIIRLNGKKNLKALSFKFPSMECMNRMVGTEIYVSVDGKEYLQKADEINGFTEEEMRGHMADLVLDEVASLAYFFAGDEAQYIKIVPPADYPCKLSDIDFSVLTFIQLHNLNQ